MTELKRSIRCTPTNELTTEEVMEGLRGILKSPSFQEQDAKLLINFFADSVSPGIPLEI